MLKVGIGNVTGEGSISSSSSSSSEGICDPSVFRIKLTTDSMRWDSVKILPSKEFEECILANLKESSRKALESWLPVNMPIYDIDTGETYSVTLTKKESFWFHPFLEMPKTRKEKDSYSLKEPVCYDLEKARKEFVYSIQPFKHIIQRRGLKYGQEIGIRFSGSKFIEDFEFSVLYSPLFDVHSFRFLVKKKMDFQSLGLVSSTVTGQTGE